MAHFKGNMGHDATSDVYNMDLKRNNAARTDAQTMPSGRGFASIMVQSAIAL